MIYASIGANSLTSILCHDKGHWFVDWESNWRCCSLMGDALGGFYEYVLDSISQIVEERCYTSRFRCRGLMG